MSNSSSKRSNKSWTWSYFTKAEENGIFKAKCNIFSKEKEFVSSTSGLISHLAGHNIYKACSVQKGIVENENMTESDDSSDEAPSPNLNSTKSKKINVALLRFLIATNQPISLVDNKIFQSLIENLYKPFKIPRSRFFS